MIVDPCFALERITAAGRMPMSTDGTRFYAYTAVSAGKVIWADGEKEYKVVSLYDGYEENGDNSANNVRSAYDVAKVAYEQNLVGETFKTWLLEKYLLPNGYTVA